MSVQNTNSKNPPDPTWYIRIGKFLQGIAVSMYRTTMQYFKNIPSKIINKFRTKRNEKKRLPKRNSANRIYVLVGYTTQAHIDNRFRKEKSIHIIRNVLIACVIALLIVLAYRSIIPMIDSEQYQQMLGIDDVKEMTKNDPFEVDSNDKVVTFATEATTTISETTSNTSNP